MDVFICIYTYLHANCVWDVRRPYATSVTLTALANVLNTKEKLAAPFVDKQSFFNLTLSYARSHRRVLSPPDTDTDIVPHGTIEVEQATTPFTAGSELRLFRPVEESSSRTVKPVETSM